MYLHLVFLGVRQAIKIYQTREIQLSLFISLFVASNTALYIFASNKLLKLHQSIIKDMLAENKLGSVYVFQIYFTIKKNNC